MKKKLNIQFLTKKIKLFFCFFASLLLCFCLSSYSQTNNPFLKKKNQVKSNIVTDKRTILIVFDASRSMEDKITGETKIHIAKRVLEDVLTKSDPDINLGLRVYGASNPTHNQYIDCSDTKLLVLPGTNNRRAIISEIYKVLPRGFTPITYSLSEAIQDLIPYTGEKSIILISDGLETCGADPCELAQGLARSNIDLKIDVVGFGIKDDFKAQEQLMCIALNTNGKYFSAENDRELTSGLRESINKTVTGKIITKIGKEVEVSTEETEGYKNLPVLKPEKINLKKKR